MCKNIVFRTIKTPRGQYAYDRNTNAIISLTNNEYDELHRVEIGEVIPVQSNLVKHFQGFGLFTPNEVVDIEHYGSRRIALYAKTRMKQLILQITTQCNLRCAYCTYAGNYTGQRTHANQQMSLAISSKAIDFFLERNNEISEVVIGFYGGEPLLEFSLLKQSVEYAKSLVEGKTIHFNMTTNGTLLTDAVVDYLVENDFYLSISIDGSKEEHDRNRKFVNGTGSFDIIISNIKRLLNRYPEFSPNVSFMTTINPHMDLECVLEYFSSSEVFSDRTIIFNNMAEQHYNGSIDYDYDYYRIRKYEYVKMLFALINKVDGRDVSPLVGRAREAIAKRRKSINNRVSIPTTTHHGGPCLPGVMRLFVRVDGSLFPCERVGELMDYYRIGTLQDGLDIERIKELMNIGKLTKNECISCWGLRMCMICSAQVEFKSIPKKEDKVKECPKSLTKCNFDLYELCVLSEYGYDAEGDM